ncbi:MAG: DUF6311 domain-containing protein [Thermoanaerobaculia bacterium]
MNMSRPGPTRAGLRREWRLDLAAAMLGVASFLYFCDPAVLSPRRVGWLLGLEDPAQSFLSWQFFRDTPLLQFPLGLNSRFGTDLGSSIVFSDSLPLLALPLKLARALLPPVFQYHGAWILGCLVLQGVTARRLLARFHDDAAGQLLGAAFFVLSPSLLWRLNGHFSLLAHWILLGGLALFFSPKFRRAAWLALLSVAVLIHAYLFVMAAGIWAADLFSRGRAHELRWRRLLLDLGLGFVLTAAWMYVAGYFVAGDSVTVGGFGYYRMNLLSPVDPTRAWSRLLPALPHAPGEYEGFNFLGSGLLVAGLVALVGRLRLPPGPGSTARPTASLIGMGAVLFVYSLSNHVYAGQVQVASYAVPPGFEGVVGAFRASGRMFWPVAYLLYLLILVGLLRRFPRRIAIGLLSALLALQAVDLSGAAAEIRGRFRPGRSWSSPLQSPFWEAAGGRYDRILVVPPGNDSKGFVPLSYFAALHHMTINSGYYNRFDGLRLRIAARRQRAQLDQQRIDPRALYVFRGFEGPWESLLQSRSAPDFVGRIDGYAIFAPGFGPVDPSWQSAQQPDRPEKPARHHRRRRR